jgi:ribose transport system ATP-binding protein
MASLWRHGQKVDFTVHRMISLMVGRAIEQLYPPRARRADPTPALEVRGVSQHGIVENISFTCTRARLWAFLA